MVFWLLAAGAAAAAYGTKKFFEMNKRKLYEHSPLRLDRREIRVLKIKAGGFKDDIVMGLETRNLDDPGVYTWDALSYCWGDDDSLHFSSIDNRMIYYKETLAKIIRQLRHETVDRIVWIDALCINQESDAEKTRQMRFMRDIYGKAMMTIVYLGPETGESTRVLNHLLSNSSKVQSTLVGGNLDPDWMRNIEVWAGFRDDLMSSKWFTRVWTVQELIASQKVIVKCGDVEVPWDLFVAAWRVVRALPVGHATKDYYTPEPDAIEVLESFRTMYMQGTACHLKFLIDAFAHRGCKDPRDKVFGLLGLASAEILADLDGLGYENTMKEVYTTVTVYVLQKTASVDFMLYRGSGPREAELPSWVPDYSQTGDIWQLTRDRFHPDEAYNASGKNPDQQIDRIESGRHYRMSNPPDEVSQIPKILSSNEILVGGLYMGTIKQVDTLAAIHRRGVYEPPAAYNNDRPYPLLEGGDYKAAFARMILFDRDWQARRYGRQQMLLPFPRVPADWERARLRGYSLIYTDLGLIGLARDDVLAEDWICVLYGCSVPVVIRAADSTRYKLICGW